MIIQANVVLKTVVEMTSTCAIVIFRVKVTCNLSISLHSQQHHGLTDRRPINIATLVDQSNQ